MKTYTYADVSTTHITRGDDERLGAEEGHSLICIERHRYGYWVYIGDEPPPEFLSGETTEEEIRSAGFSEKFITIMKTAKRLGVMWVKLDRDTSTKTFQPPTGKRNPMIEIPLQDETAVIAKHNSGKVILFFRKPGEPVPETHLLTCREAIDIGYDLVNNPALQVKHRKLRRLAHHEAIAISQALNKAVVYGQVMAVRAA